MPALSSSDVNFNITSSGGGASDGTAVHNLDSITVFGTTYTDLIVPDGYTDNIDNGNGSAYLVQNGTYYSSALGGTAGEIGHDDVSGAGAIGAAGESWNDIAIDYAFGSRDLNKYQSSDTGINAGGSHANGGNGDYYTLTYSQPIIVGSEGFMAISERNGNNDQVVDAFAPDGTYLGTVTATANVDYIDTGADLGLPYPGTQDSKIAVFSLQDFAADGTEIGSFRVSYTADGDGPDGKIFVIGDKLAIQPDPDYDPVGPGNLVTLYDFDDGSLADEAGNDQPTGTLNNGATVDNTGTAGEGELRLENDNSSTGTSGGQQFNETAGQADHQIETGTVELVFAPDSTVGGSWDTIFDRTASADGSGVGDLRIAHQGGDVIVYHGDGTSVQTYTIPNVYNDGEDVRVTYDWDANGTGNLKVENLTTGAPAQNLPIAESLTLVQPASEPIILGTDDIAGQQKVFEGDISYVAIYDNTPQPPSGDKDGDGILDIDDLDDDNDGILDTEEGFVTEAISATSNLNDGDVVTSGQTVLDGDGGVTATLSWTTTNLVPVPGRPEVSWRENEFGDLNSSALNDGLLVDFNQDDKSQPGTIELTYQLSEPVERFELTLGDLDGQPLPNGESARIVAYDSNGNVIPPSQPVQVGSNINIDANNFISSQGAVPNNASSDSSALYIFEGDVDRIVIEASEAGGSGNENLYFNISGAAFSTEFGGRDTDGDGIPDHCDLDSDNDGISDLEESGADASVVDTDGDGVYDNTSGPGAQVNSDGIPLAANGGTGVDPVDSDNDGIDDYRDLDSDNDGISDFIEAQPTGTFTPYDNTDTDGDGVIDIVDNTPGFGGDFGSGPTNTDGTDNPDYLDDNSDNDTNGNDQAESGLTTAGTSTNGIDDGSNVTFADQDGDITPTGNLTDGAVLDNSDTDATEPDFRSIDDPNAPPVDGDETDSFAEGDTTPIPTDVIDNATDPDGDTVTIDTSATPTVTGGSGTVTVSGDDIIYTPDGTEQEGDVITITYQVTDGNGGTDTSTVTITVGAPPNEPPVDGDESDTLGAGDTTPIVTDVTANGTDPDGDPVTIDTSATPTLNGGSGTVTVVGDDIIYTPDGTEQPGDVITIDYQVTDGNGGTDTSTVTITVEKVLDGIVQGGAGNDLIDDSYTGDPDCDMVDANDEILPGEGDNDDIILGFDGDDVVNAGDGDDEIYGGGGDDTIDAASGDDVIYGDSDGGSYVKPDDPANGAPGDDEIEGGAGNDTVYGEEGNDIVKGDSGDDTLFGGDGDDLIEGGSGDDSLFGGDGFDKIVAGPSGDDELFGGDNNDTLFAGPDDTVFGGAGPNVPEDYDILDLTGSMPPGGSFNIVYSGADSNGNGFDGKVDYFDASGNPVGTLEFAEIEEIIPCFTPGSMVKTANGEVPVEELKVGDMVLTRDNGFRPLTWVGGKSLAGADLPEKFRPIRIKAGALGLNTPERDMLVSPQHRMLVGNEATQMWFGAEEVLVAAKHLTCLDGVEVAEMDEITYIHVMFDQHEVVCADGAWSESFQPGDLSLASLDDEARAEIFELFPELEQDGSDASFPAARLVLKSHEAPLLFAAE